MASRSRDRDALGLPVGLEPMARKVILAEILGPPLSRAKRVVARPAGPIQVSPPKASEAAADGSEG